MVIQTEINENIDKTVARRNRHLGVHDIAKKASKKKVCQTS